MPTKRNPTLPAKTKPAMSAKATAPVAPPVVSNKRGPKGPLTDEHKMAMVTGRAESKAVSEYLDSLKIASRRGRRRTTESIATRLATIDEELAAASGIAQLKLRQERIDLTAETAQLKNRQDADTLESAFVANARSFGTRHGIGYQAWRESGVSAAVLRKAGIIS